MVLEGLHWFRWLTPMGRRILRGYETVSIGAHSCAVGDSKLSEIRQIVDGVRVA